MGKSEKILSVNFSWMGCEVECFLVMKLYVWGESKRESVLNWSGQSSPRDPQSFSLPLLQLNPNRRNILDTIFHPSFQIGKGQQVRRQLISGDICN